MNEIPLGPVIGIVLLIYLVAAIVLPYIGPRHPMEDGPVDHPEECNDN